MGKIRKTKEYLHQVVKILKPDKKDIFQIYFLAIISGLLSLTLPLGIQAVVNIVVTGMVTTSWLVLTGLVLLGVMLSGIFQIIQLKITENIRQRIFVRASFEFADRIPRIKSAAMEKDYLPEIVNRIFDTFTIQKGLPKLLYDISQAVLNIIFGMLLLSLYNTYFIFFGILTFLVIGILIAVTWRQGILRGLDASNYKYQVADWLEELARSSFSFKATGKTDLHLDRNDELMDKYLGARRGYFRILINQNVYLIIFKLIITAGLLLVGGFLAINQELNLGQFVAAEIVIILIINSVEKLIEGIETVYDLIISTEKLTHIMNFQTEDYSHGTPFPAKNYKIRFKNFQISDKIFGNNLKIDELELKKGEKICISGDINRNINDFLDIISGMKDNFSGLLKFNETEIQNISKLDYHHNISTINRNDEIFRGRLVDNISLDRSVTKDELDLFTNKLNLNKFIESCPDGLNQKMFPGGRNLDSANVSRILMARALLKKSEILVANDIFGRFEPKEKNILINVMLENTNTVLISSNDPEVALKCDRLLKYRNGKIEEVENFRTQISNRSFQELIK